MTGLRHITKSYDGLTVLHDISLEVPRGRVTAVVGPSGAGKTTLLQVLGTLERPDSGEVVYDGRDVLRLKERELSRLRNRQIGFVFQFHHLLPEFDVVENVAMPALIAGEPRREAFSKARGLIGQLGLGSRESHRPGELSGGERQRVAVARALINDPALVLADEPSGSLDSQGRAELHRLFFDINGSSGRTFVIVTHDEQLAAGAHTVVHMADGRITDITHRQP